MPKISKAKQEEMEKKEFANEQIEEAVRRMQLLSMSPRCISAFRNGKVWESEGIGALYECNPKEKQIIAEFEKKYGGKVYHLIHDMFEFGECYSMLYVSKEKEEWQYDKQDIMDGIAFVYVKNMDDDLSSEFGSIGIRPNIGGLRRTA